MSNFVSVDELNELRASETPVRVIDVRWRLDRPDGHAEYLRGHIPGAVYVPLSTELATHGEPSEGRHPLPSTQTLQDAARRWGVNRGDLVVAYDDAKGLSASRAWWLLRQGGVDVRVLDGGIGSWTAAGLPVATDDVKVEPGDVVLDEIGADAISIDEAASFPEHGVLLDVRAPERYRGDHEPLDPIGGHIPGALNLPMAAHLNPEGKILDVHTLQATFADVGVTEGTPVAAYCGSGITAAHTALVLDEAGIEAKVFPGSWSQWSNTPGRAVAVGEQPG
ncbi:sulfurtransferase [Microbacterium sp. Leaf320]|uniref:sulfurtransferase n=1 Tax=Microbacterium sp. Leaf320 TaxID=1736334 RepID=UPI0006F214F8|nr:sulfurtransferase [Microbacterium sp. Leaf320]KQQ67182.1 thiosulfate sulfurtransferase [Microbacterium sp. Leaf320]